MQGYRYFAQRLLDAVGLSPQERRQITQEFDHAADNVDDWPRIAATVLARTARTAALVTPPRAVENHFKHLELIGTQGRMVLLVLVLQGGSVQQQMLTLADPCPRTMLSQTAQIINLHCVMLTAEQVRARTRSQSDDAGARDRRAGGGRDAPDQSADLPRCLPLRLERKSLDLHRRRSPAGDPRAGRRRRC